MKIIIYSIYSLASVFLVSFTGCNSKKNTTVEQNLDQGGALSVEVAGEQHLSIIIAKPNGILEYNGKGKIISIGSDSAADASVMYQLSAGPYSMILDENSDGFPDTGVMREGGKRIKFKTSISE